MYELDLEDTYDFTIVTEEAILSEAQFVQENRGTENRRENRTTFTEPDKEIIAQVNNFFLSVYQSQLSTRGNVKSQASGFSFKSYVFQKLYWKSRGTCLGFINELDFCLGHSV